MWSRLLLFASLAELLVCIKFNNPNGYQIIRFTEKSQYSEEINPYFVHRYRVNDDSEHRLIERQGERPVTRRFHASTTITDRLAVTSISRIVYNPLREEKDLEVVVYFPASAILSKIDLGGRTQIVEETNLTQSLNSGLQNKTDRTDSCNCTEQTFSKFLIVLSLRGLEQVTINLSFEEVLEQRRGNYEYNVFLSPGEVIEDFSATFSIKDSAKIGNFSLSSPYIDKVDEFINMTKIDEEEYFVEFRMNTQVQAAFGQKGFIGPLTVKFSLKKAGNTQLESFGENFIFSLRIPGYLEPIPQHVIILVPSSSSSVLRNFIQNIILGSMEKIKPWGQLTLLPQNNSTTGCSSKYNYPYKRGFINTVISINFVPESPTKMRVVVRDDTNEERWMNINLDEILNQEAVDLIFSKSFSNVVFKHLSLAFTQGVKSTDIKQFQLISTGDEIKLSGRLYRDTQGLMSRKFNLNISGVSSHGDFIEQLQLDVESTKNEGLFYRAWSLLQTRHFMSLDVYSQEDLDLYKAISAEQGFLTQVSLLSAMDNDGVTQGFKFEDIVQQVDNNTPKCIRSSQAFKRRRELQKNKKCQIFLKMNQAQLISLEKSTPLIQFESSLQSPPNPFTEPSRSSPDSSFNSALHSANPGDFNDTPKPGFSTKQRQDTPFSWIDNSLPLSTGKVNLKNAFRKSLRKSLRKSKSAKAAIRKRSIYMVEVDDKASEEEMSTDGTENEKVQVHAKIQGDCCWILFSSTYFQGRRETVCGGERTISIPAVNSVKKV